MFPEGKGGAVRKADNLTTFMCRLSWNLGASTSWSPQRLSRPVMGLLYENYSTGIFSMSTHLATYSTSQPETVSGPNIMAYADVLSNYTHTYIELDCFKLTFLMINAIMWLVVLPPITPDSKTSLSVTHLPLVQTAERCRLFVIVQDRSKLHTKYGGSWYQHATKKTVS